MGLRGAQGDLLSVYQLKATVADLEVIARHVGASRWYLPERMAEEVEAATVSAVEDAPPLVLVPDARTGAPQPLSWGAPVCCR